VFGVGHVLYLHAVRIPMLMCNAQFVFSYGTHVMLFVEKLKH